MTPLKETLSKLSTYLLLNHQSVDNLSLNDGKLGISLALLLSSRAFDDKCLRQCAEELWLVNRRVGEVINVSTDAVDTRLTIKEVY